MENQVFERDYTDQEADYADFNHENFRRILVECSHDTDFFERLNARLAVIPRMIIPEDKAAYEDLLPELNCLALRYSGRIKGIIDYENYDAHIYVTLPFIETADKESRELLERIMEKAHMVTFQPTDDGYIEISVMFNYFQELDDQEEIVQQAIREHPVVSARLEEYYKLKYQNMMEEPAIAEYLETEHQRTGENKEIIFERLLEYVEENSEEVMRTAKKKFWDKLQSEEQSNG